MANRAYELPDAPGYTLRPRELQVLKALARGLSHKQIGKEMGLKDSTVSNHAAYMRARLGASNNIHAVQIAHERGLI